MAIRKLIDDINKGDVNKKPFFVSAIERFFEDQANTNGNRDSGGFFRPSGITQCARLNLYNYLNVAPFVPPDVSSMKRMFRGTEHHRIWYDIFVGSGLKVRGGNNEKTFVQFDDPVIFGHYDWIITDSKNSDHLIEWKSTEWLSPKISWEHNVQWNLYSYILGIHKGYLVKENPATLEILPIKMELDKPYIEEILGWLRMIEDHANKKEMLEYASKCGPGKSWKQTCPIYQFCHGEEGNSPWKLVVKKQRK